MSSAATPFGRNERPPAPIAPRWSRPSGRKNAHRGLAVCRRPASGKPCSQALVASGKNRRSPTTARRAHLLPQGNPTKKSPVCQALQSAAAGHAAITVDGGISEDGLAGTVHVSAGPNSINVFLGAGLGGGGEAGFTVGPEVETSTQSTVGVRSYVTAGAGNGLGVTATATAGTNGASANLGFGFVKGLLAETGVGIDFNIPVSLAKTLCK